MNEVEGRCKQNDRNRKEEIKVGFEVLTALTITFAIFWNLDTV
jgi:hypothetical protein